MNWSSFLCWHAKNEWLGEREPMQINRSSQRGEREQALDMPRWPSRVGQSKHRQR
jgi:hypothetical protein